MGGAKNLEGQLAEHTPSGDAPTAATPISAISLAGQIVWNSIKNKFGGK